MATRYAFLAAALCFAILVSVETQLAHILTERRLQRDIEFLSTSCPGALDGHPIISTVLLTAPFERTRVPVKMTCIYSGAHQYADKTRRVVRLNK